MQISRRNLISGTAALPLSPSFVTNAQGNSAYATKDYEFREIAQEELPLNNPRQRTLKSSSLDEDGVFRFVGETEQTHPVAHAQWICRALVNHTFFDEEGALEMAVANGHALLEYAVETDGALYFPYSEPFAVHGIEEDTLDAPWFSGMGQGQVLAAFTRLFVATGDSVWKDAADSTFASFVQINNESLPWSSTVGQYDTLWFEEFPVDPPCTAFNGHVFAAFGVYEYWLLTKSESALDLLRGAFYTIELLGETYRNPGGVSAYCLEHRATSTSYHSVHIAQLLTMYSMTHDPVFAHLHDDFYDDANPATVIAGTLTLPEGPIETFVTWSAGGFREREMVTIPETVSVSINQRVRVGGTPDYAYHVVDGEYDGLIVREQPFGVVIDGLVTGGRNAYGPLFGTVRYYEPAREAHFFSDPNYIYKDDNGALGERIDRDDFKVDGPLMVLGAGIANGSQLTLVRTNDYGEVWISSTPRYTDRNSVYVW